jgi:tRNA-specific 2-thiouridylase
MRIWGGEEPAAPESGPRRPHGCYGPGEEEEIATARAVAQQLGIPHAVADLRAAYRAEVLGPFCDAYRAGQTPNPCVRCNPRIKFGALLEEARRSGVDFDLFATGHYARLSRAPDSGSVQLRRARDRAKDQSYFLYALGPTQLAATRFPLGELTKEEVRARADALGLPPARAAESQDFMAGHHGTLFDEAPPPGPVLDLDDRRVGEHRGIIHYTVGQRRGLGIAAAEPLYVVAIDAERNAIIVGPRAALLRRSLIAGDLAWTAGDPPPLPRRIRARIRYRHREAAAWLRATGGAEGRARVEFDEAQSAITPGQAVVFYDLADEDLLLGGGTILSAT